MFRQFVRSCERLVAVRGQYNYAKIHYSVKNHNSLEQKFSKVISPLSSKSINFRQISTTCCSSDDHQEVVEPTTRRLANPDQIDGEKYVESLCLSLHETQPDRYGFLTALVNKRILSSSNISKCHFLHWNWFSLTRSFEADEFVFWKNWRKSQNTIWHLIKNLIWVNSRDNCRVR